MTRPRLTKASRPGPKPERNRIWMIMLAICAGGALVSMDSVIIGVALPFVSDSFAITATEYAWVGSSYLLGCACLMPVWEPVSEVLGRKSVILAGLGLFLAGSLISACARNSMTLIMGRAIQGIGEGAFTVVTNVSMADLFNIRERGLYIAMYSGASCMGAAFGPLLGGVLTQYANWRWCFWINLPVCAVALVLLMVGYQGAGNGSDWSKLRTVDWLGMLLITGGTLLLLLGLQSGGSTTWQSAKTLTLLLGGIAALAMFAVEQTRVRHSIVPLALFRARSSAACLGVCASHGITYIGCIFYLPVYLSLVLGLDAFAVGCWTLVIAVPTTVAGVCAALVIRRTQRVRTVIIVAAAALTLGTGLFIGLPVKIVVWRLVVSQLGVAVGISPLFQAPLMGLQTSISRADIPRAYGFYVFLRTLSSAISLAFGQVVLQSALEARTRALVAQGVPAETAHSLSHDVTTILSFSGSAEQAHALRTSMARSLDRVWMMYTAFAILGVVGSVCISNDPLVEDEDPQCDARSPETELREL
ncbi:hypothetical protein CKM354_000201100 [Cercospora kikuchii]|uniref:Major facilitator superfamily (MFS) profile domain-containing protein n=1 Tax=Cercospora kikuchii TaxID=84275 RepID=A0A9P3C901_9PEZI|nr:uncharacterized protein CKM354_000201100 [Cercospora kikuchii]GIZ38599.1 hypothetical protein CKM354_000201100 [Cercospora kikuchii]